MQVLQLDLCGRILTENVIINTIVTQNFSLPALTTISLTGAYQLTDFGLSKLARCASALQSVNLSQCSLLTNEGINLLVKHLKSTLRVLYIDYCQNIDAVSMLPALRKLNCLEVLSVAGIETVDDYFVTEIVRAHCLNMRQLVLANCGWVLLTLLIAALPSVYFYFFIKVPVDGCRQLTDRALKFVGKKCSRLCALDLSHLDNLTDATMQYLADGCRSICSLKLCRNNFRLPSIFISTMIYGFLFHLCPKHWINFYFSTIW